MRTLELQNQRTCQLNKTYIHTNGHILNLFLYSKEVGIYLLYGHETLPGYMVYTASFPIQLLNQ